ncbi:MAG: cell division protein FtsL [Coxiella sp. (in: Bacteria)]|nr:MAG: cell division protein FtsL [Coxiella sp. (in: g-proteobacteria)]
MNAITRVHSQQIKLNPFAGLVVSSRYIAMLILFLCVFASAVGVVYMKDLNRRLFIQYQGLQQAQQQYDVEWGKLLLEQSAWSTQARVQAIAGHDLGMVMPSRRNITLVDLPQ